MTLGTHAAKLDRWLGAEKVAAISDSMRDWYGPPIAVAGVPGNVWAHRGGDFRGTVKTGAFASARDSFETLFKRIARNSRRMARGATLFTGFASFSDLIAEATAGKRSYFPFQKAGPIANYLTQVDCVNTAFSLVRIFDDAAIAFLEVTKSGTGAGTYTGDFQTVIG